MRDSNRVCPLLPTPDPSAVWEHGEEFSWARCCLHPASANPLPRAALLLPSSWPGMFLSTKASHPWDRGSPQTPWHMPLTAFHSRDPRSYSGPLGTTPNPSSSPSKCFPSLIPRLMTSYLVSDWLISFPKTCLRYRVFKTSCRLHAHITTSKPGLIFLFCLYSALF